MEYGVARLLPGNATRQGATDDQERSAATHESVDAIAIRLGQRTGQVQQQQNVRLRQFPSDNFEESTNRPPRLSTNGSSIPNPSADAAP